MKFASSGLKLLWPATRAFFGALSIILLIYLPALLAGLIQKKPHVIIATCPTPFAALAAWGVSALLKIPFILEVSDLWPASIMAVGAMREGFLITLLEKLEIFLYKRANQIVVLTSAFKSNLKARGIEDKKIKVVLSGVNLNKFYPRSRNSELATRYQFNDENFVVGYIGTFGMAHGLENIVYAAEILKTSTSIRFLLVGTGVDREKLIHLVKDKSLNNICMVEPQPRELIPEFWSLCNMAIVHLKNSPAFSEVIPSKIYEAMGMGIPIVIVAPAGEATALIQKENIGISLLPGEPAILAQTLLLYSQESKKLLEFSTNSFKASQRYSRENQAKIFINIIQNIIPFEKNIQERR